VCRGAEIQTKQTAAPMHLKSYPIDGKLFRVGAVNYYASGLNRQDNDLIVIVSAEEAAANHARFRARFASGEALTPGASNRPTRLDV